MTVRASCARPGRGTLLLSGAGGQTANKDGDDDRRACARTTVYRYRVISMKFFHSGSHRQRCAPAPPGRRLGSLRAFGQSTGV